MSQTTGFDFSLLEEPLFQYVVVADSHDKLPTAAVDPEFPSRQWQHDRVTTLLALLHRLPADFLIHLGDLVQEYPETKSFPETFRAAVKAFHELPMPIHHVAGNHDVGDKPDRTMPTHPASEESLAYYHEVCGRSWYRIDREDCALLVINSQILDSGMPAENEQRLWLESELSNSAGKRVLLFLHLPLYLGNSNEPATGNYDVLGNPSRRWLLDLIAKHDVSMVSGAHVHFAFFDTIDRTEYHQLASPCFTRPGFSHLFSSPPPSERGRNDQSKLGFYLVRIFPDAIKQHFIRTAGARRVEELVPPGSRVVVFPADGGQRGSPLGVTLREPILREVEVPIAFPSVVRQRVRNDYPFYNLREMGAAHLRVPSHDWEDESQRSRLSHLMKEGVSLTLFSLKETPPDIPSDVAKKCGPTALEWQLPGQITPPEQDFPSWAQACREKDLQTILAPVIPGSAQKGKQHPRTRIGYSVAGVVEILKWLHEREQRVDRLVIDLGFDENPWDVWTDLAQQRTSGDPAWDLKLGFDSTDDDQNCLALAEAFALCLAIPGSRLLVDPLTDHDRTMDAGNGLTDTLHNPRPSFAVYRALNGILFPETKVTHERWNALSSTRCESTAPPQRLGGKMHHLDTDENCAEENTVSRFTRSLYSIVMADRKFALVLDADAQAAIPEAWSLTTLWDLRRGQSRSWSEKHPVETPYLISYT